MEERATRPKFYNPFTKAATTATHPYLKGFFRGMPLHTWRLAHIRFVLDMAAQSPEAFGFPQAPTCVVNTASFLPSLRSRQQGVLVYGAERGCKNLIIPPPCSREGFDKLDAKLMEPLFRWNPGLEYLYLCNACETMAAELAQYLVKCRGIKKLCLVDWTDAVAIRKIAMACRQAEMIDTFTIYHSKRHWMTEENVQAVTTLIEMHPKLRQVVGTREWLVEWYEATRLSRCAHNVALVAGTCDYVLVYLGMWVVLVAFTWWYVVWYALDFVLTKTEVVDQDNHRNWASASAFFGMFGYFFVEWSLCVQRGLAWTWWVKNMIVAKMRIQKLLKR